jgi:hypothetical protein
LVPDLSKLSSGHSLCPPSEWMVARSWPGWGADAWQPVYT